jgi:hypothetical protein
VHRRWITTGRRDLAARFARIAIDLAHPAVVRRVHDVGA